MVTESRAARLERERREEAAEKRLAAAAAAILSAAFGLLMGLWLIS